MNILFLGNSFTYYNDLPLTFATVARSVGMDVDTDMVAFGGHYFNQYADFDGEKGKIFLEKLTSKKWDYVILQEQSFNPVKNYDDFYSNAEKLVNRIRQEGATPVFYQTWAYRDGTDKLATTNMSFDDMYNALKNAYVLAGEKLDVPVVPVGTAFYNVAKQLIDCDVYIEDNFHPSAVGTMLAASVFLNFFQNL